MTNKPPAVHTVPHGDGWARPAGTGRDAGRNRFCVLETRAGSGRRMTSQVGAACPTGGGGSCDCEEQWLAATTLDDLARLNGQWLRGGRCSSFSQGAGPDEEASELVEVLAEINRLGLITDFSQPGEFDGKWAQRASVSGFCSEGMGELASAWYVQIFDPKWGRNDLLWLTVLDALRRRPLRHLPRDGWDPAPGCVSYD